MSQFAVSAVGCGEVRTASFAIDAHHCVQRILLAVAANG
jgi:hypothetical protein